MKRRPTKPTAAVTAEVVRLLRAGVPLETAFKVVLGARYDDGFAWLLRGAGQHPDYPLKRKPWTTFYDAVTRAQAEAEVRNTAVLQRGGSPKWALAWLRARAPKNWPQPSTKVEITTPAMLGERRAAWDARIAEIRGRAYDPRALPEGAPPPFDAPLAERLAYLREHTPDPRALPEAIITGAGDDLPITSTVEERTSVVDGPAHLSGRYYRDADARSVHALPPEPPA